MEYKEVQSLTVNGNRYDSFPDREARESKLPQPGEGAGVGQYLAVAAVDEAGRVCGVRAVDAPRMEAYELPVAGESLGGVKNGGNVTVNSDGTMTAPESQVSDGQVAAAVSQWIAENPEAVTTVGDGTVGRIKLADDLLAELGLDANHHLTAVPLETMRCSYDGTPKDTGSYTMIKPFRTPAYIKISATMRPDANLQTVFSSSEDFSENVRYSPDALFWRPYKAGELEPMYLDGVSGYEYCRMMFKTSGAELTAVAYYDSYENPVATEKTNPKLGLWTDGSRVYIAAVVPYRRCEFYLADGSRIDVDKYVYGTNNENIFAETVQPSLEGTASNAGGSNDTDFSKYVHLYKLGAYREQAAGETYLTFDAAAVSGRPPKYLVFPLVSNKNWGALTTRDAYIAAARKDKNWTIRGGLSDTLPIRIDKFNYPAVTCPLVGKHWLLMGDSITDWFAGRDYSGEGFASKIALEFDMTFSNIAYQGENLNGGITRLNTYIAGVEAGENPVPDYITIAYGANGSSAQIGTTDDSADANTYPGWVKKVIGIIREKFPRTVIGFVLPMQGDWVTWNGNPYNKDIKGNHDAIKAVLQLPEYAVPYIDMYYESGIVPSMLPNEEYPNDTIHPRSEWAQELYYRAMRRFVMGL